MDHQHRRVFRGRGGPTDRRLPKYNARRRKIPRVRQDPQQSSATDPTNVTDLHDRDDQLEDSDWDDDDELLEDEDTGIIGKNSDPHAMEIDSETTFLDDKQVLESAKAAGDAAQEEIRHLLKRIRNNRESMQLSGTALAEASNYEKNVLQAVHNSVRDWKSILRHFDLDAETKKTTGGVIFELLQQAMQVGPLAGSKPGYFKRCGADVAQMVLNYLNNIIPDREESSNLCLTEKQSDAVEKWKENASKAILCGKDATKSVVKRQDEALKQRAKRKG